jgi:transposase-like protein
MNDVTRRRRRSTAAERAAWAEQYDTSGLAQGEFAARHGLGFSTLQRWLAENPAGGSPVAPQPAIPGTYPPTPARAPVFAEVKLPLSPAVGWTVEVVRPGGPTLRLTNEVSPALLTQRLRVC